VRGAPALDSLEYGLDDRSAVLGQVAQHVLERGLEALAAQDVQAEGRRWMTRAALYAV